MSTRPPIPQGRPPPYAFVGRVYRRNLRPVVIACGCLAGLWTLIWGISEFQAINIDKSSTVSSLATFDIILGALYLTTTAIEAFGVFSAVTQRIPLVRLYTLLSLVAALLVFAAEVITIVLDFMFRQRLINECTEANTGDIVISRGWWGSTQTGFLDSDDANRFCTNLFNHNVFADFAWLFVSTILSLMFSAVAFSFYRQLLDPASTLVARQQAERIPLGAYPPAQFNYPPPSGPAPNQPDYVPPYPGKLPGYDFGEQELGPEKDPGYGASTTNPFERRAEEN